MRFDFAMLADAAQVVEGKLYIHGGALTRITAGALPWTQPIAMGMRLEPDADDDLSREFRFRLTVVGPDSDVLAEHETPLSLQRPQADPPAEGEPLGVVLGLTLNGLVFRSYGLHRITLGFDGAESELRFAVVPPP